MSFLDMSVVQGSGTDKLSPTQNNASESRQKVSFNEGLMVPSTNITQRHSFSGVTGLHRKVSDYISRKISVTKQEKPMVGLV